MLSDRDKTNSLQLHAILTSKKRYVKQRQLTWFTMPFVWCAHLLCDVHSKKKSCHCWLSSKPKFHKVHLTTSKWVTNITNTGELYFTIHIQNLEYISPVIVASTKFLLNFPPSNLLLRTSQRDIKLNISWSVRNRNNSQSQFDCYVWMIRSPDIMLPKTFSSKTMTATWQTRLKISL